jgi:hypothetical protein
LRLIGALEVEFVLKTAPFSNIRDPCYAGMSG